jgi:DNA-binding NarL/FixJ family response regulator
MYDESVFAELAFAAGARGYVTKQESPTRLIGAVREALKAAGQLPGV